MVFRRKKNEPPVPEPEPTPAPVGPTAEERAAFEARIAEHERLLAGFQLFGESLAFLYRGQDDIIETHRKTHRNVVQDARDTLRNARRLLEHIPVDPARAATRMAAFSFDFAPGHPDAAELQRRARALADARDRLFPGRDPNTSLSDAELAQLVDAAAATM